MRFVVLDFETYFADDFTLSKMSTESYIRDPRFKAHGAAVKWSADTNAVWYDERQLRWVLQNEDWSDVFLISHHAHFDHLILSHHYSVVPRMSGCTLSMARLLLGNHLSVSLDNVRAHFQMPAKRTPYHLFKNKRWEELDQATQQLLAEGACDEVESIWKIFHILLETFPREELITIDTTVRMFTQPCLRADVDMLARIWEKEASEKQRRLRELGVDETALQSADVFQSLLEAEGVEVEYKDGKKKAVPCFAKTDPFMQNLLEDPNERVRALAEARLAVKSTLLQTRAETFGYMANRGPMCVYLRMYGAHTTRWCLPADAQLLTDSGWVRMDRWVGQRFLQWDPETREFTWCSGGVNLFPFRGNLLAIDSTYVRASFTPEHKVAAFTTTGAFQVSSAADVFGKNLRVPLTGCLRGGDDSIAEPLLRLLVAVQADGSIENPLNRPLRFKFRKPRKVERLKHLLAAAGIPFTLFPSKLETVISVVRAAVPPILWAAKQFEPWLLQLSLPLRKAFIDELQHWDGEPDHKHTRYSTTQPHCALLVEAIAVSAGYAVNIHIEPRRSRNQKWADKYLVCIRDNSPVAHVRSKAWSEEFFSGIVGCPATETGFFPVRCNGHAFITGNSGGDGTNFQNLTKSDPDFKDESGGLSIRESLLAPEGYLLGAVDASQIECRILNFVAGQWDVIENFRDGRDPYVNVASQFYGRPINKKDHPTERNVGKVLELQAGYGSGGDKIRATLRTKAGILLTPEEGVRARDAYRDTHPAVVDLWKQGGRMLSRLAGGDPVEWGPCVVKDQKIILPNGCPLLYSTIEYYVDNDSGDKYWRVKKRNGWTKLYGAKLVENLIQALARAVISQAMIRLRAQGYRILTTTHDEILTLIPKDGKEQQHLDTCIAEMSRTPSWLPGIPLAAEGSLGERYSK